MRAQLIPDVPALAHPPLPSTTALQERRLLPVGAAYLAHVRRAVHNLSFEEHDKHAEEEQKRFKALNGNGLNGEDDLGVGDEEETEDILSLDPKEWKVSPFSEFSTISSPHVSRRNKITTPSLVFHTSAIKQPMIKSR